MARFIELTVFTEGTPNSRLNPERHTPTLVNVDYIRWVRASQNSEQAFLRIGGEAEGSASYITVDEPYSEILLRLLSEELMLGV